MNRLRATLPAVVAVAVVASDAAAQRRVTGVVQGAEGGPLSAASIQVVGTTTGTFTNEAGRFSITVPEGPATLRIRRIGYRARTLTLTTGQAEVNVTLEKDVLQLEAQVVTGTATSVARANAANAVAQVSAEELTRAPAQTVDNALQGKIAGAIITTNSGAPGGGSQVQLRGVTSINASSSPLYVVDGVIISNQSFGNGANSLTSAGAGISNSQDQQVNRTADLNPEDIESIEVLKGPAAGAIYGSKASNGVIVIRTKRGQNGRPQLGVTQRLGTYQLQKERKLNFRCFDTEAEALAHAEDHYDGKLPTPFGPCNDFEEQFYKADGPSYQTTLSLRGGTAGGTTYFLNGLAQRDNAIQKGTYYNKQSITANIGQTIGSRLTLQSNNNFIHTLTDRGLSGNDNSPVVSPVSVFSNTPTYFPLGQRIEGVYPANPYLAGSGETNPFQTAELVKLPQDVFRYIGSVNATYNVLSTDRQTFDITALGGIDAFNQDNDILSPPEAYFEPADGQPGTLVDSKTVSVYANLNASGVHRFTTNPFTATTSFGMRREYRNSDQTFIQGRTTPPGAQNIGLASNYSQRQDRFRVYDLAFFAQEEFLTLSERLLLTAAINAERSTVNGDPKKFYAFPKFAASYRIPFTLPYTNEIKARAAYGRAGNQPPFGASYTALVTGVYGGQLGARPSLTAGLPDIRPETSTEFEGGLDFTFFGGRAALETTVFRTDITDLILFAAPAPSSGFTSRAINGGEMYKTGTELALNVTPVQRRNLTWTARTTFSNFNSRVTNLDVPCFNGGSYFSVRYGAPWVCEGSSITTAQAFNGFDSTFVNGVYQSRARRPQLYESAPDFQMGLSNDVTLGRFRVSGLLDWRKGGKVVNLTNAYFDGTELFEDTAAVNRRNTAFGTLGAPVYLESGSFLKLREVNLSYAIPTRLTQRAFGSRAQDVRLELSGRNLYTWAPYTGYDPEVSNFGNQNIGRFQDVTPYPPSRSFFVSLSANF